MSRSRSRTYPLLCSSTSARSSGSYRMRSPTWICRTCWPIATTVAQASRLPILAVAGITRPPPVCRSPASPSVETSTRSCSIRIGRRSSAAGGTLLATAAMATPAVMAVTSKDGQSQQHGRARRDRADALHAQVPLGRVGGLDEPGLGRFGLSARNLLGLGPDRQLVDGAGQTGTGLDDLGLDGGRGGAGLLAHAGSLLCAVRSCGPVVRRGLYTTITQTGTTHPGDQPVASTGRTPPCPASKPARPHRRSRSVTMPAGRCR